MKDPLLLARTLALATAIQYLADEQPEDSAECERRAQSAAELTCTAVNDLPDGPNRITFAAAAVQMLAMCLRTDQSFEVDLNTHMTAVGQLFKQHPN